MRLFRYQIPSKAQEGLKALVISNLRYFSLKDNSKLDKILEELKKDRYDAIYIVGNLIEATNLLHFRANATYKLGEFIKNLGSIAPTYIAMGKHDLAYYSVYGDKFLDKAWIDDSDSLKKFLSNFKNVYIIEDEPLKIKDGYTLGIVNPNIDYMIDNSYGKEEVFRRDLVNYEFLRYLDREEVNTLLCSDPYFLVSLYKAGFLKNVNLAITGVDNSLRQLFLSQLVSPKERDIRANMLNSYKDIKAFRGKVNFYQDHALIVNPAIKSLADSDGVKKNLDLLFYEAASVVEYIPRDTVKRVRKLN